MNRTKFQEPPATSDTAQWFCITTNPNCQGRAALELYALGFRTFLPKIRKWVSHARVRKAVEKPLLGRYMFVEVDHPRQSFGTVSRANGVEGFVKNPDPVPIPARYVENFRIRYMAGEWDFVRTDAPCPWFDKKGKLHWRQNEPLQVGARIKLVEGEFSDMLATVTARKGHRIDFKLHGENRYGRLNDCSVRAA
jgi:transcription antitermination factor NusG